MENNKRERAIGTLTRKKYNYKDSYPSPRYPSLSDFTRIQKLHALSFHVFWLKQLPEKAPSLGTLCANSLDRTSVYRRQS